MLISLLFSLHAAAAPLDPGPAPTFKDAALLEYLYARARWVEDRTLRSFVRRDRIGRAWGQDTGSLESNAFDEPNEFEREISKALDALIRLELRWAERLRLAPVQVWNSFYIFKGNDTRLYPRAAQARLEDLNEIVAEVRVISPSLADWLVRFVTGRFGDFADWVGSDEDEAAWRARTWYESQLYDHRSFEGNEDAEVRAALGLDPTADLVHLEEDVRVQFGLSKPATWEHVHHLLKSWQEHSWTNAYRPRQFAPEPAGWRAAMIAGVGRINALAHDRLVGNLTRHEQPENKFSVSREARPWSIAPAEAAFAEVRAAGPVDERVTGTFYTHIADLRARRPYRPVPIDPKVAADLGARLLRARAFYPPCAAALEAWPAPESKPSLASRVRGLFGPRR